MLLQALQRRLLKGVACIGILGIFRSISPVAAVGDTMEIPQYSRIHIQDPAEYPLLYRLLETYITRPETAASVKEVVFRPRSLIGGCTLFPKPNIEPWVDAETARNTSKHSFFYQGGVDRLGLSTNETEKWVKTLTWMEARLRTAEKKFSDEEYAAQEHFEKFLGEQDYEFATHATALLLLLCPNIERFVYGDNDDRNPVKMTLRRNNYGLLPQMHLQNLREVVLLSTDDFILGDERLYVRLDIIELTRMFHRLPNITSITAEAMDHPRDEYQTKITANSSNLKNINITHSIFGSQVLAALIRAPKALEELTVTTGGRSTFDGSAVVIGEEIGKALLCQKNSLLKLDLDLGWIHEPWPDEEDEDEIDPYALGWYPTDDWRLLELEELKIDEKEAQGPQRAVDLPGDRPYENTIGSLHDFEQLTHLSISIQHLAGRSRSGHMTNSPEPPHKLVDILPPNLEYLLLRGYEKGYDQDLDKEVDEMLEASPKRFPKLKHIHGVAELIPEGEHVDRPDEDEHLLYVVPEIDTTWHIHQHDEL